MAVTEKQKQNLKPPIQKGEVRNPKGTNRKTRAFEYVRNQWKELGFEKPPEREDIKAFIEDMMLQAVMLSKKDAKKILKNEATPIDRKSVV